MPLYKATIEFHMGGDDIDWLWETLSQIREIDGVSLHNVAPHHDNPPDYPEFKDD